MRSSPEMKRAPTRSDYSGSYDKEIIFEGSKADTSRISQRPLRPDEMPISCMPLRMEVSIDGDSEEHINDEPIFYEQASQPPKETNKEFHDAHSRE